MPKLAARATQIRPSPTIAMNARALQLKQAGRDIIALSLGAPDFHTPDNVKTAGIAAIRNNFTKYTATDGFAPLKGAIIEKLLRENGTRFTADQIVVGGGAKVVILAALMSVIGEGDEVLIPTPYWVTYPDQVEMLGGKSVFCEGNERNGFKLMPSELKSALTTRSRALIFNSPNNPSGAVYTESEIRALADVLRDFPDVWIVTDELYEHLVFDRRTSPSFIEAAPDLRDRIITINGFSKGYVMTGWRLAFAAGPGPVIKAMGDLLSQMTGSPSSIAQAAAIEALAGDQRFIEKNRLTLQARRDLVVDRLATIPGLSVTPPGGTFYVFINCGGWLGRVSPGGRTMKSDTEVAEALLDEAELATVPGSVFGASPYFRISISLDETLIVKAMDRLEQFAAAL
jgi:aspartate aminotransferase